MFSLEQIQQIREWAIKLNVWEGEPGLTHKISKVANESGLDHALFFGVLESLIPAAISQNLEDKNFINFMKLIVTEIMKSTQSAGVLKNLMVDAQVDTSIFENWVKVQKNLLTDLLTLITKFNEKDKAGLESGLKNYKTSVNDFVKNIAFLKTLKQEEVEKISTTVLEKSQMVTHNTFEVLGLRNQIVKEAAPKIEKEKKQIESKKFEETHVVQRPILRRTLEKSFEAARIQQFALSGHNFFLSCARPAAFVSRKLEYAEQMSAVLMSQQMVLSDRYVEDESNEKLKEIAALEEIQHIESVEKVGNFDLLLQDVIKNTLSDNSGKLEIDKFQEKLTQNLSQALVAEVPNLSNLLVNLNNRDDSNLIHKLSGCITGNLDDVIKNFPKEIHSGIQLAIKGLFSKDNIKKMDGDINLGLQKVGALIGGDFKGINKIFDELVPLKDISIGSLAENLFNNVLGDEGNNIWKNLSNGLGGHTFADVGQGAMGVAINQFLPVVTKEIFGDSDFGKAASSALSGAVTGFTVGGPVGALVGAGVSLISSIFGGNAEAEAKAQRQQMQQMFEAVSTDIKAYTGACFEQLDQRMMRGFENVQYQMQVFENNIHDDIERLGLHMDKGFSTVLDGIDNLNEAMRENVKQLHQHLSEVAEYNQYRFDRLENKIYEVGEFLYEGIRDLQDLTSQRFDRIEAMTQRAFMMLDRKQELRFAEQRKLLLKIREEQKDDNQKIMDELSNVKEFVEVMARVLVTHHEEAANAIKKVIDILEMENKQKLIKLKSQSNISSLKKDEALKLLNKIDILSNQNEASKLEVPDQKIIIWSDAVKLYLYLFFRFSYAFLNEAENKEDLKNYSLHLKETGLSFQQYLHALPQDLSKRLTDYQTLIYQFYQAVSKEYINYLETPAVWGNKSETATDVLPEWANFKSEIQFIKSEKKDYRFEGMVAKLNNRRDRNDIQILDVLNHGEDGIGIYALEKGELVYRVLDLNQALNLIDSVDKDPKQLLKFPIILSDYREISTLNVTTHRKQLSSYKMFYEKWKDASPKTNSFNCSTQGYAIYCVEKNKKNYVYTWHPKHGELTLELPDAIGKISSMSALMRRGKLTIAIQGSDIWLGQWDVEKQGNVLIPCAKQEISLSENNSKQLLREWRDWYLLSDELLIDPTTLMQPSTPAHVKYDSDHHHVRIIDDFAKTGTYFDYRQQRYLPTVKPYLETSAMDQSDWIFYDQELYLNYPTEYPLLTSTHLPDQKHIGILDEYDVYAEKGGEILLIKKMENNHIHVLNERKKIENEIWEKYKKTLFSDWLKPFLGTDPVGIQDEKYSLANKIREYEKTHLESLKRDLKFLLMWEIENSPELNVYIDLVTQSTKQILQKLLIKDSENNFYSLMLEKMRAFFNLQQQISKIAKKSVIDFPNLNNSIDALNQVLVLQGANVEKVVRVGIVDSPILQLCSQALGLGLRIEINKIKNNNLQLEVKVFGQPWSSFTKDDRLFIERFHEEGQHQRVLNQLLEALEKILIEAYGCQFQKTSLKKMFYDSPDKPIHLDTQKNTPDFSTSQLTHRFFKSVDNQKQAIQSSFTLTK